MLDYSGSLELGVALGKLTSYHIMFCHLRQRNRYRHWRYDPNDSEKNFTLTDLRILFNCEKLTIPDTTVILLDNNIIRCLLKNIWAGFKLFKTVVWFYICHISKCNISECVTANMHFFQPMQSIFSRRSY